MSNDRKVLKILSIIFFVGGILTVIIGLMGLATGSVVGHEGGDLTVYSIVMIAMGVIEIVTATFGIRGANNPAKIGPVWVWSIVCFATAIISVLLSEPLFGGIGNNGTAISTAVIDGVYFMFANRVKKANADRLG